MSDAILQRPQLVLFDLDGTLADTAPDLIAPINVMRRQRHLDPMPVAALRPYASAGAAGLIGAGLGITQDDARYEPLRTEFLARYQDNMMAQTQVFPGIAELLDRIEAAQMRWGVVSNKIERWVVEIVTALGLAPRAAVVIGGDSAARPKPYPDPLQLALARTAVAQADQAIYIGDDPRDLESARAAGMPMIAAAYGYVGTGAPPQQWGADAVIEHPGEVAALLQI